MFYTIILLSFICFGPSKNPENDEKRHETMQEEKSIPLLFSISRTIDPKVEDCMTLENFDDIWGLVGDPIKVEAKLTKLLKAAEACPDRSIYPQILSQIALAQGMQKKFNEAHASLDRAKALLETSTLVEARILLDRGKVYQQSEHTSRARKYFEQSYTLSIKHGFELYAIDAAHMIAIISDDISDKLYWNERAIELANRTDNLKARSWLGSLYNNIGQNYLEAGRFEDALAAFTQTLHYRQEEGFIINIRVAKWAIACALRELGRFDEALKTQLSLFSEYNALSKNNDLGMPIETFDSLRGFVCEELAKIYEAKLDQAQAAYYACLAYELLSRSNDPIFLKSIAKRLEKLKQIQDRS